jgi:hypothetical protein
MTQAAAPLVRRGPDADPRIVRRRLALWLTAAATTDWWTTRWPHVIAELGAAAADARRLTAGRDRALGEAADLLVEAFGLSEAALRAEIAATGLNRREQARRFARDAVSDWALTEAETAEGR